MSEKQTELYKQWELIRQGLNHEGHEFDLSKNSLQGLIDEFNIKVQKCSTGYICFKGVNIGMGITGSSSGRAFCNYLKHIGVLSTNSWEECLKILIGKN